LIPILESAKVARNKASEAELQDKARTWIEGDERAPGLHASDMLDEMMAYWQRVSPKELPDKLINLFLVGKVLHAFVLGSVSGSVDIGASDAGSSTSDELGISYSPDAVIDGIVRELKTSRALFEPRDLKDIDTYLEQLLVYMVATNTCESQLWIFYINLKNPDTGRTDPTFRCYDFSISADDLAKTRTHILDVRARLERALENRDPRGLTLCREFKCGAKNCQWYAECKPVGRFGDPVWDGLAAKPRKARKG
jgi:hypothetical protein